MKKITGALTILFLIGGIIGYLYPIKSEMRPYTLNYNHAAINIHMTYTKKLSNPTYPLGEKYLAEDMMYVLREMGIDAKLYTWEETYSNRNFREGYEIYLRFYPELQLPKYHDYFDEDRIGILVETIPYKLEEVKNADLIFTGSLKKDREYKAMGLVSHFLPQFTRTDKFYYAPREEYKNKLLFIGNQWNSMPIRNTVKYALRNNLDVAVYGAGWKKYIGGKPGEGIWKAKQIPGDELKYYYSSADIVLNDTRPEMIEAGFISNRIFDVTACKGFIISDYIPEIGELYGDAIPMYKTEEEFLKLIDYYLVHPEERREKAQRAYEITVKNFNAKKVIGDMWQKMEDYRKQRGLRGTEIWPEK